MTKMICACLSSKGSLVLVMYRPYRLQLPSEQLLPASEYQTGICGCVSEV